MTDRGALLTTKASGAGGDWRRILVDYSPWLILALLIVVGGAITPLFLTPGNLLNILQQSAIVGVLTLGQFLVILTSGIDLSVGSLLALSAMVGAIGGTTRVIIMEGPHGGHAYTEACIHEEPTVVATKLARYYGRAWARYAPAGGRGHIAFRRDEACPVWLNLDWNAAVPGGDYEPESWAVAVYPDGHTDPSWFAGNAPFSNPTELLLAPDHYLYRMLYSQGIALDDLRFDPPSPEPGTISLLCPVMFGLLKRRRARVRHSR